MKTYMKLAAAAMLVASTTACGDFLTGGELSTDPNRPVAGTTSQYFVGVQSGIWALYTGDLSRMTSVWAQHFNGTLQAYVALDQYSINEGTTNGQHQALYIDGGLVDVRKEQAAARAVDDSLFLGIAQVQEAMIMGLGADAFGDLSYSHALTGEANPVLDPQLDVYDSVQTLLDRAIINLNTTLASNRGPGAADLVYGGNAAQWRRLAYTLKARYYMNTAEVRGATAYTAALAAAPNGILASADDYYTTFTGDPGEQSLWYQFMAVERNGYMSPGSFLDSVLVARGYTALRNDYFQINGSNVAIGLCCSSGGTQTGRLAPTAGQPIATAAETQLIWAEAACRLGQTATALTHLNAGQTALGVPTSTPIGVCTPGGSTGAMLTEILTMKYIANFQLGVQAWRDYRRTCFPNLPKRSTAASAAMPGRFYYDINERQTNTSIPLPGTAPNTLRPASDPPNATADGTGGACLAGSTP